MDRGHSLGGLVILYWLSLYLLWLIELTDPKDYNAPLVNLG